MRFSFEPPANLTASRALDNTSMHPSPTFESPPRVSATGRLVFAATLVGLGVAGLAQGDFAAIWQPVPKAWPLREALIWITCLVSVACGIGLLWRRTAAPAAGVLAAVLLVWMLALKAPVIVRAPTMAAAWESCGETAVLAAAGWALAATIAAGWRRDSLLVGERGLRLARGLYGLAMLAFGAAHLAYVEETASLIPSWLPAHAAWVWLTGLAYIAAGAAVLAGVLARLAAALSAVQMGVFTLLVWTPMVAGGHADASAWSETVISWTLTAAGWAVADTYCGTPWLAVRIHPTPSSAAVSAADP